MDFDTRAKLAVYAHIVATSTMPCAGDIAQTLGATRKDVLDAFARLRTKRLLVLEPNDPTRIRMAPPFSGIPTQHVVHINERSYYANCAWDAFGVSAALHRDADIESTCGDCNEPLDFQIRGGAPISKDCAVHFAVPAAHWWDDIILT